MSIRTHLTRLLLLAIVPLVLAIGAALFLFVRADLVARFDDGLLTRASALAAMVKLESGEVEFDFAGEAMPQYEHTGSEEYFQLWTLQDGAPGRMVERSGSLGEGGLAPRVPRATTKIWDAPMPDGRAGRCAALRFTAWPDPESEQSEAHPASDAAARPSASIGAATSQDMLIVVAQGRRELDRTLGLLAAALSGAGVILLGGMLLAVRMALARGLSPIAGLAAQIESIRPDDLSARIAAGQAPAELAPIAQRTNAMLERLTAAFEREKRLAASAAHELRTPIAEMRAVTELALARERPAQDYRAALATALAAAERMGAAADAVLRLARVQSGRERLATRPVDVLAALGPAWDRWIAPLAARGVRIALEIPPGTLVRADPAMLGVALDNLCANAAQHTSGGGDVLATRFDAAGPGGVVTVRISNAAAVPGNEADQPADAEHPPSRAAPADAAEASEPMHAGLGLVIAGSMLAACGGTLATDAQGGRFTATIRLAAATAGWPPE